MSTAPRRPDASRPRAVRDEVRPHRTLIAALAVIGVVWAVWVTGPGWTTPAFAVAAVAGAALGVIDARTQRLPNAILYPTFIACAVLLTIAAAATGEWMNLGRAALGAGALGGAYLAINLLDPAGRSLGLGDVKLAVLLGLLAGWVSWRAALWTGALPFLIGAAVAVALIAKGRGGRGRMLTFGPFMLVGAAVALAWSRLHT